MVKIMEFNRAQIVAVAKEIYEGENLEIYLKQISKTKILPFSRKVQDRFLANLKREHSGKNFVIGQESLLKANLAKKIGAMLKG